MRLLEWSDVPLLVQWEKERPYPWNSAHFFEAMGSQTTRIFVFLRQASPLGFVVIQIVDNEGYLQNIMIESAERKKGWGVKILQKVIIWAKERNISTLTLDVDPENIGAVALYRKFGFIDLERRKKSYPKGEDAIVMRKLL